MQRSGQRHYKCIRCEKKSSDEWATDTTGKPISRFDEETGQRIEYENIDLCKKCFGKTQREIQQTYKINELRTKGEVSDDDLVKLNDDKQFKVKFFQKHFEAKKGDLKKRNAELKEQYLQARKRADIDGVDSYRLEQDKKSEDDRF